MRENKLPPISKPSTLEPIMTKKPVEMPKKVLKIGDITDQEKKKIELSFRFHLSSLNKLIQERIRNNAISGPKPQPKVAKPASLVSTDSHLTRSQTFDANKIKAEITTGSDPVYEEIWRNLKRYASTKSKYKYRDINNYEKKVLQTMKTLLGRNNEYININVSPKQKGNLNLEDDTDKYGKKFRSPEKGRSLDALNEFQAKKKEKPGMKVFIIIGGYMDLRRALEDRGWVENPDPYSKDFHLKWTCKKYDINYDALAAH